MERAVGKNESLSSTRRGTTAAASVFLVVLAVGIGTFPVAFDAARVGGTLADGEWTWRFEAEYADALPFRDAAVTALGWLRFRVFGEGRPGVVVGSNSWLFTSEEFAGAGEANLGVQAAAGLVDTVSRRLADRNISLVVALVPAKARIYSEKLRHPLPPVAERRYRSFRRALGDAGIVAPDLATALAAAKTRADVFHPTDTHWTALGSHVAAESISQAITEALPALVLPRADFAVASAEEAEFTGDLVSYLSLGSLEERLGPPAERATVTILRRVDEGSVGLFGTPEIPVTLVGTSYSADPRWGFETALKRSLASDVLTVASEGRGPFAPMEAYLAGNTIEEIPPRVVIWEIPERYVTPAQ